MFIKRKYRSFVQKIFFLLLMTSSISSFCQDDDVRLANEYYLAGEYEKAKIKYDELSRKSLNIPFIYINYVNTLTSLEEFDAAEKLIKKCIKTYPDNIVYKTDLLVLYRESKSSKGDRYLSDLIKEVRNNSFYVDNAADYLIRKNLFEDAKQVYLEGRKNAPGKSAYALGLAKVNFHLGKKRESIDELLNELYNNPGQTELIKNILQNYLTEAEDFELLESILYEKVQKDPENIGLNELLLWINIQNRNFRNALIQAKAIDKKNKTQGSKLLEVGMIALENKDYQNAEKFFQYIADKYSDGYNYHTARRYLILTKELTVKNTFPLDLDKIRSLVGDYRNLIRDVGRRPQGFEAMRSMASLYAFYLNENDSAVVILYEAISLSRHDFRFMSQCKMDLADIKLLTNEPWEASLLLSQVEKDMKEDPLGHEAKLKNAKIAYYNGEFELAQGHLDILKMATTREIANDAMDLSILIQDNLGLDTSAEALEEYASIDLLLFQNRHLEALQKLDSMLLKFPKHSLTDEIYWLKYKIYSKTGNIDNSLLMLDYILTSHKDDIFGDDALFAKGQLYDFKHQDKEKAILIYTDLLIEFPGSIFSAEARKRIRFLRGDKI